MGELEAHELCNRVSNVDNLVGREAIHQPDFCAQKEASYPAAVEGDVLVEGLLGTAVFTDCQ